MENVTAWTHYEPIHSRIDLSEFDSDMHFCYRIKKAQVFDKLILEKSSR